MSKAIFLNDSPIKNRLVLGFDSFSVVDTILKIIEKHQIDLIEINLARQSKSKSFEKTIDFIRKAGAKIILKLDNDTLWESALKFIQEHRITYVSVANKHFDKVAHLNTNIIVRLLSFQQYNDLKINNKVAAYHILENTPDSSFFKKKNDSTVPVIIGNEIPTPSMAGSFIEKGIELVYINKAIAISANPLNMAKAFDAAICAGKLFRSSSLNTPKSDKTIDDAFVAFLEETGQ